MERSEQLNELAAALAKCQGAVKNAAESGKNPHLKNSYSTLADVWDACRKPLSDNGLAVTQFTEKGEAGTVRLVTLLLHSSGQFLCGDPLEIPVGKHDAQSYGSSLTYARRYGLAALVGVCPADADDDGEGAQPTQQAARQRFESRAQEVAHEKRAPESRGDQGAQRARAAVERQEQPAAALVEPAPDALPEGAPERDEIRFLVDRCERANVSDARTLGGALSWSNSPTLTEKKAAAVIRTLKAALPAEPPPSVSPGEVPAAFR